jgi:hypothetical protein
MRGALVAVERGSRDVVALIKRERLAGRAPLTHGGVVEQVWRGGGRQASLARLLPGLDVVALGADLGPGADGTASKTSSLCAAPITARCIAARSLSQGKALAVFASFIPTVASTVVSKGPPLSTFAPASSPLCAG